MSACVPVSVIMAAAVVGILGAPQRAPAQCVVHEFSKLTASDAEEYDNFGLRAAISGDVVVFGAPDGGSAYVFRFDGTNWVEEAQLIASDTAAYIQFGDSVAVSGDVVVIGAPWDHDEGTRAGAVYVFRFDGAAWIEEAKLKPSDPSTQDRFGNHVSVDGDLLVVGVRRDDDPLADPPTIESGSAYVFRFDGSEWIEEAKLTASDARGGSKGSGIFY